MATDYYFYFSIILFLSSIAYSVKVTYEMYNSYVLKLAKQADIDTLEAELRFRSMSLEREVKYKIEQISLYEKQTQAKCLKMISDVQKDAMAKASHFLFNICCYGCTIEKFYSELRNEFNYSYVHGMKWLSEFIVEAESKIFNHEMDKSAGKDIIELKKELELKKRELKYIYETNPYLLDPDEYAYSVDIEEDDDEIEDESKHFDRVKKYLTREEYDSLSESERNQKALDNYLGKYNQSRKEIGRMYERYVGYLHEVEGWDVEYNGIKKSLEDMGIDLICKKSKEICIIQAKYWASDKIIHEKHIFQLFGTCIHYGLEKNIDMKYIHPKFYTTTDLSDVALKAAQALSIEVVQEKYRNDYPMIKCNINEQTQQKIYHLPFDQKYDTIKINREGEYFVRTVKEAEEKGFRRAKRHKSGMKKK